MNPFSKSKIGFSLISLVIVIYTLRQSELSFTSPLNYVLRALANTKLSESFCAEINIQNPLSSMQVSQGQTAISTVLSLRGTNRLMTYLTSSRSNDDSKTYGMTFIGVVVPWVVMLLISILCLLGLCCNWCYLHGCCKNGTNCQCCRAPKHQTKKGLCVGLSVFFLLGMIGAGVAGLIISLDIPKNVKTTMCSVIGAMEDLNNGVPDQKWMGLTGTVTSLNSASAKVDAALDSMTKVSNNLNSGLSTQRDNVKNAIKALYDDTDIRTTGAQITRANPAAQSAQYTPLYIANLGPVTDTSKNTGMMTTEVEAQYDAVSKAGPIIDQAIDTITPARASIKDGINQGLDITGKSSDRINDILNRINDNQDRIDQGQRGLRIGLIAFFAVNFGLATFAILAIVFLVVCRVKVLSKCLHLGWCIFILLTILSWIIAGIFFPLSILTLEGCDVVYNSINNHDTFNTLMNAVAKDSGTQIRDVFDVCIYGNGDLLSKFGLTNSLDSFDTVYTQLDSVDKVIPINSATVTSVTISGQQTYIQTILAGTAPDDQNTVDDLVTLTRATDRSSGACPNLFDKWVLNSANCDTTAASSKKFAGTDPATDNVGNPTCIGLNAWTTPAHDINARYTGQFTACSSAATSETSAKQFVTNFVANRAQISTLFTKVNGHFSGASDKITESYQTFATSLKNVLTDFNKVKTGLADIRSVLVGTPNGLVTNTNCAFVKTETTRMADATCYGLITSIYYTSITIIVMACMSLFATLFVFLLLKRVNLPVYEPAKMMSPYL